MRPADRKRAAELLVAAVPEATWGEWKRDPVMHAWTIQATGVYGDPAFMVTDQGRRGQTVWNRQVFLEALHPVYESRRGTALDSAPLLADRVRHARYKGRGWLTRAVDDWAELWRLSHVKLTLRQLQRFGSPRQWGMPAGRYDGKAFRTHGHRKTIMQGNPKLTSYTFLRDYPDEDTEAKKYWTLTVAIPCPSNPDERLSWPCMAVVLVENPVPCRQALPPRVHAAMLMYRRQWPSSCPFNSRRPVKGLGVSPLTRELIDAVKGRWPFGPN